MYKTRLALSLCLVSIAAGASAKIAFVPDFNKVYKIPAGTALAKNACVACHTGPVKLNSYGNDLKKAMTKLKAKKPTPAALKSIEKLDSDKDGVKNLAEIKAGTVPGDKNSKPSGKKAK